jgi:DNA (cytosine-5)-methyltransferase 1
VLTQAATTGRAAAQTGAQVKRLFRAVSRNLGFHRGNRRVYLDGQYLLSAGFAPGRHIVADFRPNRVVLRLSSAGDRLVSSKAAGRIPVIDINCRELTEALGSVETVVVKVMSGEIVITPTVREERKRTRCRNGKELSICAGGGLLTKAAQLAGFEPSCAVEIDQRYADIYSANFPGATVYQMPLEQVDVRELPPSEIVTLGLPCVGVANCRTLDRKTGAKRNRQLPPEAHPDAGVMVMFAAAVIEHVNPRLVVLEEGDKWMESASGYLMRYFLERLGYKVGMRVLDSHDYGYIQSRRRTVLLAIGDDSEIAWPRPQECRQTLADVLDDAEAVAGEWFTPATKGWLFRHWSECDRKGQGFTPERLTGASSKVGTLKRRYLAGQGDNPVVRSEKNPDVCRWFTLAELRRLFTLPEDFILGAKTVSGEVLGQGVIVDFFRRIIAVAAGRGGEDVEAVEQPASVEATAGQLAFGF